MYVAGPVSSLLSLKYSYRTVTVIGGMLAASGMILSFWANSIYFLYGTYGVLVGCGAGLSFPPTVYIVCSYFIRLRGVANGICISGSAFGSIIIPPLLRLILVNYGYRGACLIMGGITLNVFVAALFYDNVEKHMKRVPVNHMKEAETDPGEARFIINHEDSMPSLQYIPHNDSFLDHVVESSAGNFNRSVSSAAVPNMKHQHRERKISMPISKHEVMKAKTGPHNMSSSTTLYAVPEQQYTEQSVDVYSQGRLTVKRKPGPPKRSTSTSSFQYVSTAYHGSTLTLQPETFASSFSLRSIKSIKGAEQKEVKRPKLFDITLLAHPIYLIILISNATNAISYTNFLILLPSFAKDLSLSKDQGSYLLSIVSAFDLVGRIGGSALSDITVFPKCWYFVGGLFISGISLTFIPVFTNFWPLASLCSVFGLASGTYVGITAIVMADMLGEERLQSTYGMGLFVNGVLQLIGPPICGQWYELAQSYVTLFTFLGLTLTAGSLIWSFVPCLGKENKNKTQGNEGSVSP